MCQLGPLCRPAPRLAVTQEALVQVLDLSSPHEVPAFHWLTGWLREDVLPMAAHEGAAQASQATTEPSLLCMRTNTSAWVCLWQMRRL